MVDCCDVRVTLATPTHSSLVLSKHPASSENISETNNFSVPEDPDLSGLSVPAKKSRSQSLHRSFAPEERARLVTTPNNHQNHQSPTSITRPTKLSVNEMAKLRKRMSVGCSTHYSTNNPPLNRNHSEFRGSRLHSMAQASHYGSASIIADENNFDEWDLDTPRGNSTWSFGSSFNPHS